MSRKKTLHERRPEKMLCGGLAEALYWVIDNECHSAREVTLNADYQTRINWLLKVFGDVPLEQLCGGRGFEAMLTVFQRERERGGIKNVTMRKRFKFMLRALRKAAARDKIRADQLPTIPRMSNDETTDTDFLTLAEYRKVRAELETPWQRFCVDVAFWTGMHRKDIQETEIWHLDINKPVRREDGKTVGLGMFFFRNTKTKKHQASWLPMDPEFRERVAEYLSENPDIGPEDRVIGVFYKPRSWLYPACERAGVKTIKFKNFRQSRMKYLEDRGATIGDIRYLVGHIGVSTRVTTSHYLGTAPGPGTLVRIHDLLAGARRPPRRAGSRDVARHGSEPGAGP